MNNDVYNQPSDGVTGYDRKSFLSGLWNGDIKLWKAFWFVHLLGFVLAMLLGVLPQMLVMEITGARFPHFVTFIPMAIIFPVTLVCLWRSAPNPKSSIKGALARIWVLLGVVYFVFMLFKTVTGPQ